MRIWAFVLLVAFAATAGASEVASQKHESGNHLWTWGSQPRSLLVNPTPESRANRADPWLSPTLMPDLSDDVVEIGAYGLHVMALKSDGTVWGWGVNTRMGRVGTRTICDVIHTPTRVEGLSDITSVSVGSSFSIALRSDGSVWGWGSNYGGQMDAASDVFHQMEPIRISNLTDVEAIACGAAHAFALKSDGTLWMWGSNLSGQLGNGTMERRNRWPVQVQGLGKVVAMAGGHSHSIALTEEGEVWGWGNNERGQIGDGTTIQRSKPVKLPLTGVVAISAGHMNSLALKADGTVWAWGLNDFRGQVGDGSDTNRLSPVQVLNLYDIVAIECGQSHSLALKADGTVWAWGGNWAGVLGIGERGYETSRNEPIQVPGLTGVSSIAAGSVFSFALGGTLQDMWTLSLLKPAEGGDTIPGAGEYSFNAGEDAEVTAVPESYWKLDRWLLDGVDVGDANPITITVSTDDTQGRKITLQAVFAPERFEIEVRSQSASGVMITSSGDHGGLTDYSVDVAPETEVELTAPELVSDEMGVYRFERWNINGEMMPSGVRTISLMATSDVEAVAIYRQSDPGL